MVIFALLVAWIVVAAMLNLCQEDLNIHNYQSPSTFLAWPLVAIATVTIACVVYAVDVMEEFWGDDDATRR